MTMTIKEMFGGGAISVQNKRKITREELEAEKEAIRNLPQPPKYVYSPLEAMKGVALSITGYGEFRNADYDFYFSDRGGKRYIEAQAKRMYDVELSERQIDAVMKICNRLSMTSTRQEILDKIEALEE